MYKGRITTPITVTAGTDIPFTTAWATLPTLPDTTDAMVRLLQPGIYDVNVSLVITGVGGDAVTAQLYADGVAIPEAVATSTATGTTELITLSITDAVRTVMSLMPNVVDLSVRLTEDATVNSGVAIVKESGRRGFYA